MTRNDSNFSMLLTNRGARLAPLYDLMAGDAWPEITQNMAQNIGGQRNGRHVQAKHWRRFAEECGLTPRLVIARVHSIVARLYGFIDVAADEVRAMPAGDHYMLKVFFDAILARAKTVMINLNEV